MTGKIVVFLKRFSNDWLVGTFQRRSEFCRKGLCLTFRLPASSDTEEKLEGRHAPIQDQGVLTVCVCLHLLVSCKQSVWKERKKNGHCLAITVNACEKRRKYVT